VPPDSHKHNLAPRISNRRALHDYHIDAKIECGIALVGSEVKSLRLGLAQLQDAYARVEKGRLVLHGAHIDPYKQASLVYNHQPRRDRYLLAHRREIKKLADAQEQRGVTLIPLAIYFKDGRAKVEIGVARGKQAFDKRAAIKKKEADRDLRRIQSFRQ
jgi:SsrA-binding protein